MVRVKVPTVVSSVSIVGLVALALDSATAPSPKNPPAVVANRVTEASLTTITLTPEAVRRLALATAPVVEETVARRRLFSARVEVVPGRDVTLVAPIAGTVMRATAVGAQVRAGEVLAVVRLGADAAGGLLGATDRFAMLRSLADLEVARVDARAAFAIAMENSRVAEIELARAERLASDKAGSTRAVDEARAAATTASAERDGARSRAESLASAIAALEEGKPFDLELLAPFAGEIAEAPAPAGFVVSAGFALTRVVGTVEWQVRVGVPNSVVSSLDRTRAFLARGSDRSGAWIDAHPVPTPATSRGAGTTVELSFVVPHSAFEPDLAPGERLVAALSETEGSASIVPHSAVLRDAYGGDWVYVEDRPGVYSRRRVAVSDVIDGRAVLGSGPAIGSKVVTDGAAELFGTEFGVGK